MPAISLTPHPATPCPAIRALTVRCERPAVGWLDLTYRLEVDLDQLAIPAASPTPGRLDGLWRHTCFEVFIRADASPSYRESNFSPAGDWAAYRFDAYRQGMTAPTHARPPEMTLTRDADALTLRVRLALDDPDWAGRELRLALAAVLESTSGPISYWALRHPPGPPDFHHADSFALLLPA